MSGPTLLSAWYVVGVFGGGHVGADEMGCYAYYTTIDDGTPAWTDVPERAMIFTSLHSASRVADDEGGDIFVVWNKAQLKKWGRE